MFLLSYIVILFLHVYCLKTCKILGSALNVMLTSTLQSQISEGNIVHRCLHMVGCLDMQLLGQLYKSLPQFETDCVESIEECVIGLLSSSVQGPV